MQAHGEPGANAAEFQSATRGRIVGVGRRLPDIWHVKHPLAAHKRMVKAGRAERAGAEQAQFPEDTRFAMGRDQVKELAVESPQRRFVGLA